MTQTSFRCRENKQGRWSAQWRWRCGEGGGALGAGGRSADPGDPVLNRRLLCGLLSFSYFLLHWALQEILQVCSIDHQLIVAPARVTQYHGGCNTEGGALTVSHGWAGWRSSTTALFLKTASQQRDVCSFSHSDKADRGRMGLSAWSSSTTSLSAPQKKTTKKTFLRHESMKNNKQTWMHCPDSAEGCWRRVQGWWRG